MRCDFFVFLETYRPAGNQSGDVFHMFHHKLVEKYPPAFMYLPRICTRHQTRGKICRFPKCRGDQIKGCCKGFSTVHKTKNRTRHYANSTSQKNDQEQSYSQQYKYVSYIKINLKLFKIFYLLQNTCFKVH